MTVNTQNGSKVTQIDSQKSAFSLQNSVLLQVIRTGSPGNL